MMREVKYRGRAKEPIPDKWFYGGYVRKGKKRNKHYIVNWDEQNIKLVQVDPKSIGQYTGLKDKNGKDIYEGDILDGSYTNPLTKKDIKKYYQVVYENGCYNAHAKNHPFGSTVLYFINTKSKVIGNIYEHPHLLGD